MKIVASIQARMGSSRLPGKVLADLCGKPMLLWQIERLKRSRLVDRVVVATTTSQLDDSIVSLCNQHGVDVYRGSEDNVLRRVAELLSLYNTDVHVECYGDSPLIDPQIVDEFIGYYLKHSNEIDYVSSTLKTTYPPGFEVSVYSAELLLSVDRIISDDDPMREHVGVNICRYDSKYRLKSLEAPIWHAAPETYLEVDTQEDLTLLREVVSHFVSRGTEYFGLVEILDFLSTRPVLVELNSHVNRRWRNFRDDNI